MPDMVRVAPAQSGLPLDEVALSGLPYARLRKLDIRTVQELVSRLSDPDDAAILARYAGITLTRDFHAELRTKLPLGSALKEYRVSAGAFRRRLPERAALGHARISGSFVNRWLTHLLPFLNKPAAHPTAGDTPDAFPPKYMTASLPSQVDLFGLKQGFLAPRNQGDRQTCVAFSSCAAAEFLLARFSYLSPQHLYWACKEADGFEGQGTYLDVAAKVLLRAGAVDPSLQGGCIEEAAWPYVSTQMADEGQGPAPAATGSRWPVPAVRAIQASDVKGLKQTLANGFPIVVGVGIFHWWNKDPTFSSGKIMVPTPGLVATNGHAICLVGYRDADDTHAEGRFLFRNSWGPEFGAAGADGWQRAGFGQLNYRYLLGGNGFDAFAVEDATLVAGHQSQPDVA